MGCFPNCCFANEIPFFPYEHKLPLQLVKLCLLFSIIFDNSRKSRIRFFTVDVCGVFKYIREVKYKIDDCKTACVIWIVVLKNN